MCGRFALHANPDVVALQFRLSAAPVFAPRYNIAPTAEILAVTERGAAPLRWGLFGKVHNLRADKPRGRLLPCLVPASGFYEWQRRGARKQPFYVRPAHDALFGFAGLYGHGNCAILTVEANGALRAIHDRMPAIVATRDYARWLGGEALALAAAADESVTAYPVGAEINSGTAESARLVEPLPSGVAARGASGSLFGD
jgi:putative SOS response-associated peptidase YedK